MSTQAAVVLAGGKGTRMKSRVPKVLHTICGKEMVRLVVDATGAAGLKPTFVVVAPDSQAIRETLGDGVKYVVQPEPLGSGHALLQAAPMMERMDNVVVLSGDVPLIRPDTIRSILRHHLETEASVTLLTATVSSPDGLGRVVRDASGRVKAVVEEIYADQEALGVHEVNAGVYCFRSSWLLPNLRDLAPSPGGEILLTDLVAAASEQGMTVESIQPRQQHEALGINTRVQLAKAEGVLRKVVRERWMLAGVTIPDPDVVYIDADARLGQDTVVLPNTHITGASHIGLDCRIGPNTIVDNSKIGDGCRIAASIIEDSTLEEGVYVGPFSHVRPGSHLENKVHIGNFAEVSRSRLGPGTKSGHFSFLGDAEVGANVNIGAGTVTCNYDGRQKHVTRIGDDAMIGSDSMLVAPVSIGARASTGAGSVVSRDVPPDTLVLGVPARERRQDHRTEQDDRP